MPWIEFLSGPDAVAESVLDRIEAMPVDRPRIFKLHSAPPMLSYRENVRYVVVVRSPDEAIASLYPFLANHSDEWVELWGMPANALRWPDLATFDAEMVAPGMHKGALFGFANAWWPYRHADNTLFLHFSEMKADHAGSIRQIADFLGLHPDADAWSRILEYTSFPWMKAHEDKFEAMTAGDVTVLRSGAMVRHGETGRAGRDGMTPELSADLRAVGNEMCAPDVLDWIYTGGVTR